MRRLFLYTALFTCSLAMAQSRGYGLDLGGNVITRAVQGEIGTRPGLYASLFYGIPLSNNWDLDLDLGYVHGSFQSENNRYMNRLQMFPLRILPTYRNSAWKPFGLYGGVEIAHHRLVQEDLSLNNTGASSKLISAGGNVDGALIAGLEMQLGRATSFRIDHSTYLLATAQGATTKLPTYYRFGIRIRFDQLILDNKAKEEMTYQLGALNDPSTSVDGIRNDTLYVLNYACDPAMTDHILDSLFGIHYSFSKHRIIQREEISTVTERFKPRFFAVVGELYGGLNRPPSSGIFLLNSRFEVTQFPYPVQTDYFQGDIRTGPCFGDLDLSAYVISQFDRRLHGRSR